MVSAWPQRATLGPGPRAAAPSPERGAGYLGTDIGPIVQQFQGRLGTTREMADVIAFLASDRASFINGVAFPVDNALTERLL